MQLGGAYPGDRNVDALFENPGNNRHSVTLQLEGTKSNRCGIGAKLRLQITENGVTRSIYKDVTSGSSFGANPLRQSVGAGSAAIIDTLEVYWPTSDTTQVFHNVASDQAYRIVEGNAELQSVSLVPFHRQKQTP